jgi:hypothetical protein
VIAVVVTTVVVNTAIVVAIVVAIIVVTIVAIVHPLAQDGSQCGEFSLDGFIVNINNRTDRAVDSVTTVVEAIRGVLVPTQDILDGLTDSSTALTTMETALNDYQDASQEVRDTLTQLAAKPAEAPPIIADVPDATDVPEIDDAAIEFLTDARAEVDDSIATVTELKGEIETEITKLDDDVIPEVEEIKDDILSITGDLQKAVYDVMEKLNTADEALVDTTEVLDSNKMYFWIWVALMAPLSILVPSLALNAVVGKKATLARCSCCCQFFGGVTFWLPIIVGYILLVQTLVGDVCDVLLVGNAESDFQGLFEVNLNSNSKSFGDTEINIGTTINNLLTCRPGCDVLDVEYTPDPLPADWDTSPFNPNNWPSDQNVGLSQAECVPFPFPSLPSLPSSIFPSFVPSLMAWFPSFLPSVRPSVRPSFLPSFLCSFLCSFLPSFLCFVLPSFLDLPSFLYSFLFMSSFLP